MNMTTAKPTPEMIELEAHAVYKNIGLTPRQLADQRAELIAALEELIEFPYDAEGRNLGVITRARAAIACAKAVPK